MCTPSTSISVTHLHAAHHTRKEVSVCDVVPFLRTRSKVGRMSFFSSTFFPYTVLLVMSFYYPSSRRQLQRNPVFHRFVPKRLTWQYSTVGQVPVSAEDETSAGVLATLELCTCSTTRITLCQALNRITSLHRASYVNTLTVASLTFDAEGFSHKRHYRARSRGLEELHGGEDTHACDGDAEARTEMDS